MRRNISLPIIASLLLSAAGLSGQSLPAITFDRFEALVSGKTPLGYSCDDTIFDERSKTYCAIFRGDGKEFGLNMAGLDQYAIAKEQYSEGDYWEVKEYKKNGYQHMFLSDGATSALFLALPKIKALVVILSPESIVDEDYEDIDFDAMSDEEIDEYLYPEDPEPFSQAELESIARACALYGL
jgi:hypothetical protein